MDIEKNIELARKIVANAPRDFNWEKFCRTIDDLMAQLAQLCGEAVVTIDEIIQLSKIGEQG